MHTAASPPSTKPPALPSRARRAWLALSGATAAALGLAPHVLHHAGPLAGAAILSGIGGSVLFGAVGFLLAIPFLLRLRRRFGTWRAPVAALVLFTAAFSISTFVIGPALTGDGDSGSSTPSEHEVHHR